MKILIIGSEGFIGRNAFAFFSSKGYDVCGADIIPKKADNYTVLNSEYPDFSSLFVDHKFDICINASGSGDVQFSFKYIYPDYKLNVINVFYILENIRQFNPRCKFINFSSAAVYGNPKTLPVRENAPVRSLSPYGWHKFQSEQLCREFYHCFKVPTLSLRVFSAYGVGLKKQIFWDLYQKSLHNKTINILGTGNESRDFIYIDDLLALVELAFTSDDFTGEVVNVANGQEIFMNDIVSEYFKILNRDFSFSGEVRTGDPLNWHADISKIRKWGFSPHVNIHEGINKYIEWAKGLK